MPMHTYLWAHMHPFHMYPHLWTHMYMLTHPHIAVVHGKNQLWHWSPLGYASSLGQEVYRVWREEWLSLASLRSYGRYCVWWELQTRHMLLPDALLGGGGTRQLDRKFMGLVSWVISRYSCHVGTITKKLSNFLGNETLEEVQAKM